MLKLIILILIKYSGSQKFLEYRPGINYGQVLRDYSDNGLHAVSGSTSLVENIDVIWTDRGCYIDGSQSRKLTLPANDISTSAFLLPNSFMIAFWILVDTDQDGLVLYRSKSQYSYFYVRRKKSDKSIAARFKLHDTLDTGEMTKANSFFKGKIY